MPDIPKEFQMIGKVP